MSQAVLLPPGAAFDAIAGEFDATFDAWLSVGIQRDQVRRVLLATFPSGSRLLEIGGGTGADAAWLMARGRDVVLTDASPAMVAQAALKIGGERTQALPAERLGKMRARHGAFDGAFSNFAALNCVDDLGAVGTALARLIRPGGSAVLVVFGRFCPGEIVVEAVRGRWRNCLRRLRRGPLEASLRGRRFAIRYHARAEFEAAMAPHFRLRSRTAIGLFVPPSAAEPWISRHPRLLSALAAGDRLLARHLPPFGDHVAYVFERVAP